MLDYDPTIRMTLSDYLKMRVVMQLEITLSSNFRSLNTFFLTVTQMTFLFVDSLDYQIPQAYFDKIQNTWKKIKIFQEFELWSKLWGARYPD